MSEVKVGNRFPARGQIFLVDTIPCVILSNDAANQVSSRVIMAPVASNVTQVFRFEVPIEINGTPGKILLDQIRTIEKVRLGNKIGECNDDTIDAIEDALKIVLGLN